MHAATDEMHRVRVRIDELIQAMIRRAECDTRLTRDNLRAVYREVIGPEKPPVSMDPAVASTYDCLFGFHNEARAYLIRGDRRKFNAIQRRHIEAIRNTLAHAKLKICLDGPPFDVELRGWLEFLEHAHRAVARPREDAAADVAAVSPAAARPEPTSGSNPSDTSHQSVAEDVTAIRAQVSVVTDLISTLRMELGLASQARRNDISANASENQQDRESDMAQASLVHEQAGVAMGNRHYYAAASLFEEASNLSADPLTRWNHLEHAANALFLQGEEFDNDHALRKAIVMLRRASKELDPVRNQREWNQNRSNLGTALLWLGNRTRDMDLLQESESAYRDALSFWSREEQPVHWANAQLKLSYAIKAQSRNKEAKEGFKAALEIFEQHEWDQSAKQAREALRAYDL